MRFQVYKQGADHYRWSLVDSAASVLAESGRPYTSREQCEAAIEILRREAPGAPITKATIVTALEDDSAADPPLRVET
jgi:uncharacterized protein YegP (UPF0339 family)